MMPTSVFLTIDTEIMWRHHESGLAPSEIVARSFDPAGVGIAYQLEVLARHGLKACFFVDPMPALVFGLDTIRRVVDAIVSAGQEVQLHLHPNWTGAATGDATRYARFDLCEYSAEEQYLLIEGATELLVAAGAPHPIAFRAGSFGANGATLDALAALGFVYDSSHNGSQIPEPYGIDLPARQIAPIRHRGVTEIPVGLIEEQHGSLRTVQVCALSIAEMRAALAHAVAEQHAALTIVSHGFELANRTGTRANGVHVRRFDGLCAALADDRDLLPTRWFADRPALELARDDVPLSPNLLRTRWRQAEQLWSNWVEERVT